MTSCTNLCVRMTSRIAGITTKFHLSFVQSCLIIILIYVNNCVGVFVLLLPAVNGNLLSHLSLCRYLEGKNSFFYILAASRPPQVI